MSRPTPKPTRKGMNLTFCLREMSLTENVSTTRVSAFVIRCPRSLMKGCNKPEHFIMTDAKTAA